ncbi:MAG: hypothetical protein HRS57_00955 [Mycoplasmataceae bacterium]|nr:hypothetical protein [Mycoplasmataceae bacterium]
MLIKENNNYSNNEIIKKMNKWIRLLSDYNVDNESDAWNIIGSLTMMEDDISNLSMEFTENFSTLNTFSRIIKESKYNISSLYSKNDYKKTQYEIRIEIINLNKRLIRTLENFRKEKLEKTIKMKEVLDADFTKE